MFKDGASIVKLSSVLTRVLISALLSLGLSASSGEGPGFADCRPLAQLPIRNSFSSGQGYILFLNVSVWGRGGGANTHIWVLVYLDISLALFEERWLDSSGICVMWEGGSHCPHIWFRVAVKSSSSSFLQPPTLPCLFLTFWITQESDLKDCFHLKLNCWNLPGWFCGDFLPLTFLSFFLFFF